MLFENIKFGTVILSKNLILNALILLLSHVIIIIPYQDQCIWSKYSKVIIKSKCVYLLLKNWCNEFNKYGTFFIIISQRNKKTHILLIIIIRLGSPSSHSFKTRRDEDQLTNHKCYVKKDLTVEAKLGLLNPLYHFSKRLTVLRAFRRISVARESNKKEPWLS